MDVKETIAALGREYGSYKFNESSADPSPSKQFKVWFEEALKAGFLDPNSLALATADKQGKPSVRTVLLKSYDERGYVFYSNYNSEKGRDLAENPYASMLYFWDKLERQVRIDGKVEKISEEESAEYFKTRDYMSKLGAWASKQSEKLPSRFKLIRKVAVLMAKYPKEVPLPPFWGGYRLIPDSYEFWQGRKSRLHDRIKYVKEKGEWTIFRIYP